MSEPIEEKCKLVGESKDGQLSFNQQAMYDRLHGGLAEYRDSNAEFSRRASTLAGASTATFAVLSAIVLIPDQVSGWVIAPTVLAAMVALVMVLIAGSLWQPRASIVSGDSDLEAMYRQYLSKDADDAYYLVMRDAALVYREEKQQNERRGDRLWWMCIGLDVLIVLLLAAVVICVTSDAPSGGNANVVTVYGDVE